MKKELAFSSRTAARRDPRRSWDKSRPRAGRLSLVWAGLAAGLVGGCSGPTDRLTVYPVAGKVTVAGEVPEGAQVVLYPVSDSAGGEKLHPSGKVKSDGSFSLTTYDAEDGAPAGDYVATIHWYKLIKRGADVVAGPDVVPKGYQTKDTSPWKVSVAKSSTQLEPHEIKK